MTMEYQMITYQGIAPFNDDAKQRYDTVIAARTATSYDAFWRVEQVTALAGESFRVLWSRPAPLRKH